LPQNKLGSLYRVSIHLDPKTDPEYFEIIEPLLYTEGIQTLGTFLQHSDFTLLRHVLSVSYMTYRVCRKLGWDYKAAARAGLLHDYVTYDWHVPDKSHRLHGFRHPYFALRNSRELTELSKIEENAIVRHMWPLTPIPPKYREAWALTLVDKYCATRETLRKYQKHKD